MEPLGVQGFVALLCDVVCGGSSRHGEQHVQRLRGSWLGMAPMAGTPHAAALSCWLQQTRQSGQHCLALLTHAACCAPTHVSVTTPPRSRRRRVPSPSSTTSSSLQQRRKSMCTYTTSEAWRCTACGSIRSQRRWSSCHTTSCWRLLGSLVSLGLADEYTEQPGSGSFRPAYESRA